MPADDATYANQLLTMLRADRARLEAAPSHAPIVLWMVEELRAAASSLRIERETAKMMLSEAADARAHAARVRKASRKRRRAA